MSQRQRPDRSMDRPKDVLAVLKEFHQEVNEFLEALRPVIEGIVRRLEGKEFGSYDANLRVIRGLQAVLDRFRLGPLCQEPGCGRPARVRCLPTLFGRSSSRFIFEHRMGGKTVQHGGYTKIPPLRLVRWDEGELKMRSPPRKPKP